MNEKTAMELVAFYGTYVSAEGLTVDAMSDAPATTPACILTAVESAAASFSVSQATTATFQHGC
ncbi:hypothetical protein ACF1B0_30760 [Streptomyces anandii]|uniref:hypothetical protein n=1 Tax=Streptomyces anandii TaxID=285454 RepID=UPI0037021308